MGAEAAAPVTFGFLADVPDPDGAQGLQYAFLIMLVPLVANAAQWIIAYRPEGVEVGAVAGSGERSPSLSQLLGPERDRACSSSPYLAGMVQAASSAA
ncbi:hypothetical protein [Streptosporangium sp. NPDC002607]